MRNEWFYVIHGWMINELKLSGTELHVYAIVYGFSQNGASKYEGSVNYMMDLTGKSRRSVLDALKNLTDRGLLNKDENYVSSGLKYPKYTAIVPDFEGGAKTAPGGAKTAPGGAKTAPGGAEIAPEGVQKLHRGGAKIAPNNIDNNINNNIADNIEDNKGTARETPQADADKVIEKWNELSVYGIPQVTKLDLSTKRGQNLRTRIKQYGIDEVCRAIENIKSSPFLQGKKTDFLINFDWFVKPNNFPKVLDGNYIEACTVRGQDRISSRISEVDNWNLY